MNVGAQVATRYLCAAIALLVAACGREATPEEKSRMYAEQCDRVYATVLQSNPASWIEAEHEWDRVESECFDPRSRVLFRSILASRYGEWKESLAILERNASRYGADPNYRVELLIARVDSVLRTTTTIDEVASATIKESLTELESFSAANPSRADLRSLLAKGYFAIGDFEKAQFFNQPAPRINPTSSGGPKP